MQWGCRHHCRETQSNLAGSSPKNTACRPWFGCHCFIGIWHFTPTDGHSKLQSSLSNVLMKARGICFWAGRSKTVQNYSIQTRAPPGALVLWPSCSNAVAASTARLLFPDLNRDVEKCHPLLCLLAAVPLGFSSTCWSAAFVLFSSVLQCHFPSHPQSRHSDCSEPKGTQMFSIGILL